MMSSWTLQCVRSRSSEITGVRCWSAIAMYIPPLINLPKNGVFYVLFLLWASVDLSVCDTCQFPSKWTGSWFQKGVQDPIRIFNGTISNKGVCRQVDGDKFLIENTVEKCFRCVVLHVKHENVIQYKETYCSPHAEHKALEVLCSEINGDALLFSMFRLNTPPVTCPFKGPFTFTYSRGHGECMHPISTADACTSESHLLFRFQACADVRGSESRVEELVCLAVWKEGSTRYLVGKLRHKMAKTDEDKFRCFVYEKLEDHMGYLVAQSGDATCDGLFAATEGSRTMKLNKANHPHAHCEFPEWFTAHRHWKTLDGHQSYNVSHRNNSLRVSNISATTETWRQIVCTLETGKTLQYAQYVVHATSGCTNGYMCLRIHRRSPHVVEIQTTGKLHSHAGEACNNPNYELPQAEFVTLTTQVAASLDCPLEGIYSMEGPHHHFGHLVASDDSSKPSCSEYATLMAGCSTLDQMDLQQECASDRLVRSFMCRGSWEENGTNYVIATAVGTRRHFCIAYTENEKILHFSGSAENCLRNVQLGKDGLIALNATNRGRCRATDSASLSQPFSIFILLIISLLSYIISRRITASSTR